MTDKTKGRQGISACIVDKDDPGFSIGQDRAQDGHPWFPDR